MAKTEEQESVQAHIQKSWMNHKQTLMVSSQQVRLPLLGKDEVLSLSNDTHS